MRVNVVIVGENYETILIDAIDEYNDIVWDLKLELDKLFNESGKFSKKYVNVFYKDLILSDYKFIKFYQIAQDDQIFIGNLETFLGSELIVVEMFVIKEPLKETIYFTAKRTDSLIKIKSILKSLFPKMVDLRLWSIAGCRLKDCQRVIDIDQSEEFFKVIVEIVEKENPQFNSFNECCQIHDRYFSSNYGWNTDELSRKWLKGLVKQIISDTEIVDEAHSRLQEDLSSVKQSLKHSKYLFCCNIGERIFDICGEIFDPIISSYIQWPPVKDIFEYSNNFRVSIFINKFLLVPIKDSEMDTNPAEDKSFDEYVYVAIHNAVYCVLFPKLDQTNSQAKSIVSLQSGIPKEQLYFIEKAKNDPPLEEEVFDLEKVPNIYSYEIIYAMDNIEIKDKLGEGSFGEIIKCIEGGHKEFVIKKQIDKSSLHQEIMIQSIFRPPGSMLMFTQLFNYEGRICPAMKYMEKGSLRSILDAEKYFTESEAIRISYQLLHQITVMHKFGVIHHDVKSDNVVLDNERNPKLIDFGLSICIPMKDPSEPIVNQNRNVHGTMIYLAPELINNEPYTSLIHIWAFGIVAVEMITGCVPYQRLGPVKTIDIVRRKEKIKYSSPQKVSKEFSEFINCCLEPNSAKRLNADQLIEMPIFRDHSI